MIIRTFIAHIKKHIKNVDKMRCVTALYNIMARALVMFHCFVQIKQNNVQLVPPP